MFHTTPAPVELSLHVVGLAYPNDDRAKSNRQFEARLCLPGETVHLVPEPKNKHDPHAVAVFSQRHIQLGYLTFERCGWISAKIGEGLPVEAVFQSLEGNIAVVRARIGGGSPTLPEPKPQPEPEPELEPEPEPATDDTDFYPDPPAPEWGA